MTSNTSLLKNDRFAALAGIELVKVEPGYALAKMNIEEKHLNAVNIVQGGATFTLADYAFAAASNAYWQVDEGVFTDVIPQNEMDRFFQQDLPTLGTDYFLSLPEERKFDGIIIDEGQDFYEEWLMCLEAALKENGYFYIFVDPNQNIFGVDRQALKKYLSKHRLTVNLRNTEQINNLMGSLIGRKTPRVKLVGGLPVAFFAWNDTDEEKRLIQREVGRLVSQGLRPERITIHSPHRKSKGSLAGVSKIREWPLINLEDTEQNGIKFATVRSFKGLEADVAFLIGVIDGSAACTIEDIYVGISRGRYLLYIFHHKDWQFPQ